MIFVWNLNKQQIRNINATKVTYTQKLPLQVLLESPSDQLNSKTKQKPVTRFVRDSFLQKSRKDKQNEKMFRPRVNLELHSNKVSHSLFLSFTMRAATQILIENRDGAIQFSISCFSCHTHILPHTPTQAQNFSFTKTFSILTFFPWTFNQN